MLTFPTNQPLASLRQCAQLTAPFTCSCHLSFFSRDITHFIIFLLFFQSLCGEIRCLSMQIDLWASFGSADVHAVKEALGLFALQLACCSQLPRRLYSPINHQLFWYWFMMWKKNGTMRLKTWAGFLWWSSEREKSPCDWLLYITRCSTPSRLSWSSFLTLAWAGKRKKFTSPWQYISV